jgi:glycosyltransferase involved in cell wall biosynthesis
MNGGCPKHEQVDGINVTRLSLPLRGLRSASLNSFARLLFPLRAVVCGLARRLRGERYDVVLTATQPPVLNGLGGWITARLVGARFIYHLQDIYPETAGYSGLWKTQGIVYRLLMLLDRWNCRKAEFCVVLSDDMVSTLAARGVPRSKVVIVNNFLVHEKAAANIANIPRARDPNGTYRLVFAGNIGRFQGLEAVVDAARLVREDLPQVEFLFLGEGKALTSLRRQAADLSNVHFMPHLEPQAADRVIAEADLGVVSLKPNIYRVAYPTKTITYLALGLPLLALVETESALARMVVRERIGVVASGPTGDSLAAAIREVVAAQGDASEMSQRARHVHARDYSMQRALECWTRLIEHPHMEFPDLADTPADARMRQHTRA